MKVKKIIMALAILCLFKCDEKWPVNEELLNSASTDISGSWSISKVEQNEIDISDNYDFNSFVIALNYGNGLPADFSINSEAPVPFPTSHSTGSWHFDNELYPSKIYFVNGDTAISIVDQPLLTTGNEELHLEFNLGCSDVSYVYYLTKNNTL
jgi:hypothetical protein|tara:strand:+ start:3671 stop:4129 length:459 start_codon:yes stop_codon:yes gene_type:complete